MLVNMCLPMSHPIAFHSATILLARNSKISIESSFFDRERFKTYVGKGWIIKEKL